MSQGNLECISVQECPKRTYVLYCAKDVFSGSYAVMGWDELEDIGGGVRLCAYLSCMDSFAEGGWQWVSVCLGKGEPPLQGGDR